MPSRGHRTVGGRGLPDRRDSRPMVATGPSVSANQEGPRARAFQDFPGRPARGAPGTCGPQRPAAHAPRPARPPRTHRGGHAAGSGGFKQTFVGPRPPSGSVIRVGQDPGQVVRVPDPEAPAAGLAVLRMQETALTSRGQASSSAPGNPGTPTLLPSPLTRDSRPLGPRCRLRVPDSGCCPGGVNSAPASRTGGPEACRSQCSPRGRRRDPGSVGGQRGRTGLHLLLPDPLWPAGCTPRCAVSRSPSPTLLRSSKQLPTALRP